MGLPAELFGGRGGRRGGGKSPMLWQVFSVQMANSRRFMQTAGNGYRAGQGNASRSPKRAGEGFRFSGAGKKDGTGGKEPAGFRL